MIEGKAAWYFFCFVFDFFSRLSIVSVIELRINRNILISGYPKFPLEFRVPGFSGRKFLKLLFI